MGNASEIKPVATEITDNFFVTASLIEAITTVVGAMHVLGLNSDKMKLVALTIIKLCLGEGIS